MLTGNRFGGFATPLGAVIFFQELLLYLTMYQKPPSRLPDLWPVIISALSCGIFILFYIRMVFSSEDSRTVRSMDLWTVRTSDIKPTKLFGIHGYRINRTTEEKIRKSICQSTKKCRRKKDAIKILKKLPFKQRFVDHHCTQSAYPDGFHQSRLPYLLFLSRILVEFESMTEDDLPVDIYNSECRI